MNRTLLRGIVCFAFPVFTLLTVTGCWGKKFIQMPQNSLDAAAGVDSLDVKVKRLEWRVYRLNNQLEKQREYSRRAIARQKMDIEELKDKLNAALQLLDEAAGRTGVAAGVEYGVNRGSYPDTSSSSPDIDSPEGEDLSQPRDSLSSEDSLSVNVPAAGEIYRQVYLDYSRMDYRNALEDSKIFLEEYPDHPLEEKVYFIRGECFMQQEKFFDALKEFSKILKKYPDGEKVPGALLRTAIAYDEIGDRDLAAGVVRRLVRKYPEREETSIAKQKFGDMLED